MVVVVVVAVPSVNQELEWWWCVYAQCEPGAGVMKSQCEPGAGVVMCVYAGSVTEINVCLSCRHGSFIHTEC